MLIGKCNERISDISNEFRETNSRIFGEEIPVGRLNNSSVQLTTTSKASRFSFDVGMSSLPSPVPAEIHEGPQTVDRLLHLPRVDVSNYRKVEKSDARHLTVLLT